MWTVSQVQRNRLHMLLAAPYIVGGLACVTFPGALLRFSLVDGAAHANDAVKRLLMACFGAQACLVGTALLTCEPTVKLHRAFAVAMVPFFAFNFVFSPIGSRPLFNAVPMAMDFCSNVGMCAIAAVLGWSTIANE